MAEHGEILFQIFIFLAIPPEVVCIYTWLSQLWFIFKNSSGKQNIPPSVLKLSGLKLKGGHLIFYSQ